MPKKKLFIISLMIIFAIGIPLTLFIFNKQQEIRSRAEKSTSLYFSPASSDTAPIQTQTGDTVSLDVMANPGTNLISLIKLEILYDPTKFETIGASSFQPNLNAFPQIIEGPIATPGKILATISIGTDPSKSIREITRAGTIRLKALNSTTDESTDKFTTTVSYGTNTQVLAVDANASAGENVLSNTQPAIIIISLPTAPTCTPKPPCLNSEPVCLIPEPTGGWCPPSTPTPTPTAIPTGQPACKNSPTDTVLIIDRSDSMNGTKLKKAKEAAKIFINKASSNPNNKIALTTIDANSTLVSPLSNNFSDLKAKIDSLAVSSGTCIQCGIKKTYAEISTNGRTGYKKVAILLTDGRANRIDGKPSSTSSAENAALEELKKGYDTTKTVFYTVGLGSDVSAAFLTQIANLTGGKYFFAPSEIQLNDIYVEVSQAIGKGMISGLVFDDANKNKIYDPNENKLPGWTINLFTLRSNTPQPFISDQTGIYNTGMLCDGKYRLTQTLKDKWIPTVPTNPNEYTVDILNGAVVKDKNFGNTLIPVTPTTTPTPPPSNNTILLLNGLIDGIGSRGDNSNPDGTLSNKKPLHPARNIKISVYDASNKLVADAAGKINYSSASGSFTESISSTIPSGSYTIKATTDNHLTRLLPGIQIIKGGESNKLPDAIFTAGDIKSDNQLNISDYNMLIGCYSDISSANDCKDTTNKDSADLNDDGAVNHIDYNLFLREIATQPGQ